MENNSNGGFFSGIVTAILVAVAFIWGILWWCIVTFVRFAILTLALVLFAICISVHRGCRHLPPAARLLN
jgi:hypothetical protein